MTHSADDDSIRKFNDNLRYGTWKGLPVSFVLKYFQLYINWQEITASPML